MRAGARIVRAVDEAGTAVPGNWAPAGRPVRLLAGVWPGKSEEGMAADLIARRVAGPARPAILADVTLFP